MAASSVERHWSSAGRVRHSPPPTPILLADIPAHFRAQTAHPLPSVDLTDHAEDTIDEEIDHLFVDDDDDDDERHFYRLETRHREPKEKISFNGMNGSPAPFVNKHAQMLDMDKAEVGTAPAEQLRKLLHLGNNNDENEESKEAGMFSSPTFRRHPAGREIEVALDLPNAVQTPPPPLDEQPVPALLSAKRKLESALAKESHETSSYDSDEDIRNEEPVFGRKETLSQPTTLSYANSPIDVEETGLAGRQRSLPARRNEQTPTSSYRTEVKSSAGERTGSSSIRRMGVMPSSTMAARNRSPATVPAASVMSPVSTDHSNGRTLPMNGSIKQVPNGVQQRVSVASTTFAPSNNELQDPRLKLQVALKGLGSNEWEDKIEGIRRLDDLAASSGESISSDLHVVALALMTEVRNLRSQVSRAAIQSLGRLFQHCGRHMEQDLDRVVPLLLNKSGDTNRFIREDAHVALMNVTEYVSPPKAIVAITAESLSHKNAVVRAEAARLLAAIVEKMGPAKILSGSKDVTEKVLPAAAHFIQDGSLDARVHAKKIFSVLLADPTFERAMQKYLPPNIIRNIQRTLDHLRKNVH